MDREDMLFYLFQLLFNFGKLNNFYYISIMEKIKILGNILLVTCIVGLALSYVTQLLNLSFKLNFLEAVGVYCLWTPIHHTFTRKEN